MTTKKQKRIEGERRAKEELAERFRASLERQRQQRNAERQQELDEWQKQHTDKHTWKKRLTECPHCRIELREIEKNKVKETI